MPTAGRAGGVAAGPPCTARRTAAVTRNQVFHSRPTGPQQPTSASAPRAQRAPCVAAPLLCGGAVTTFAAQEHTDQRRRRRPHEPPAPRRQRQPPPQGLGDACGGVARGLRGKS
eukprot:scaffold88796_cov84-Phaeocystis_antarctica.AAC.1